MMSVQYHVVFLNERWWNFLPHAKAWGFHSEEFVEFTGDLQRPFRSIGAPGLDASLVGETSRSQLPR